MLPFEEELKTKIKRSLEKIKESYSDIRFELDHAGYETASKDIFNDLSESLKKEGSLITSIPHSGRTLAIFRLNSPIEVERHVLERIELFEPKPGAKIDKSFWEHIAFKVENFDSIIDKYKSTPQELQKIRQIGEDKFGYVILDDFRIQFRNNNIGELASPVVNSSVTQEEAEDFKTLYEKEKEARLMMLADLHNEKRIMQRQKEEFIRLASLSTAKDLFEIVDDIKRANDNHPNDSLKMIHNKLLGLLNNLGIIPVTINVGDKFDPQTMEALTTTKVESDKDNTVVMVDQSGFKFSDDNKILRMAKVIVGKAG